MSKLTRTLILAATVAAMNLAGLAAVAHAQANDQDPPSQQELAERWSYYQQATRVPPAELKARMQADATQRWNTDYYQATHMSPAQHEAWLQVHQAWLQATQVPPTEPNGQPTWLVVSLGVLAAVMTLIAVLALLAARRANRRAQVRPAT
jgi:hypothetical protein